MKKFTELYEGLMPTNYYFVRFDNNHRPIALFGSPRIDKVWYKAIQELGGMPVDTDGVKIDSIQTLQTKLRNSPNMLVSMTQDITNWRTSKHWFAILRFTGKIKKDKNYEELT